MEVRLSRDKVKHLINRNQSIESDFSTDDFDRGWKFEQAMRRLGYRLGARRNKLFASRQQPRCACFRNESPRFATNV